jgi:hypothetical protein
MQFEVRVRGGPPSALRDGFLLGKHWHLTEFSPDHDLKQEMVGTIGCNPRSSYLFISNILLSLDS